ncbi:MAG: hypothetical protein M3Y41_12105, partial [Pseudomonadota bacterium]|nr:hypothetical protein [Pseudomonadota bacterium]
MSDLEYNHPAERRSFTSALSAVAGARRPRSGKQVLGLVAGAVVTYFAVQGVRHVIAAPGAEPHPKIVAATDGMGRPFTPAPSPPPATPVSFAQPLPMPPPGYAPIQSRLTGSGQKTPEQLAIESDIGFGGNSATQVSATPGERPATPPGPGSQTDLGRSLQPTEGPASVAHAIPHPDFTIGEGTLIPCTNLTPISSGQAVFVTATIPTDVWGMTNKVRLIDGGATITGEIRMANAVMPGQDRIPVLWRNITTKGDSPI